MYVPSLELGLPHPFSRKRVCPPPVPKGGGGQKGPRGPTLSYGQSIGIYMCGASGPFPPFVLADDIAASFVRAFNCLAPHRFTFSPPSISHYTLYISHYTLYISHYISIYLPLYLYISPTILYMSPTILYISPTISLSRSPSVT